MARPNKDEKSGSSAPAAGGWVGGRPGAWRQVLPLWMFGAAAGSYGYGKLLVEQISSPPTLSSNESLLIAVGALASLLFLKIALIWGCRRFGRPLSPISLLIFPILNALGEGFALLLAFDAGRWLIGAAMGLDLPNAWLPGTNALAIHGLQGPLFFKEFMLGFSPYLMAYTLLYSFVWEERVLPIHLDLEAPNKFMRAIVAEQFFFIALYYATGDVATFVLFRWLSNLLTVVAVRLPPPGARCEEVPDEAGELAAAAAAAAAAGGQPERTEGKKEQ